MTHEEPDASKRIGELTEANAKLAEAIAARDAFLTVAAHELRNPMTSIAGYVHLLRRNLRKPALDPRKMETDLERLEWLVEDYIKRATVLLDVSRITTGRLHLNLAAVNLGKIMRTVSRNFQPAADHAGSQLRLNLPAEPVMAHGDPLAVEQIVDNLVSNAIKYGAGKPICLSAAADPIRGTASVQVRDQGPGIPQADQTRIFQQFERAVKAGERTPGFGIGLWLVRQLSEAMDGSVAVDSMPGAGSTFCVTLHLHPEKLTL